MILVVVIDSKLTDKGIHNAKERLDEWRFKKMMDEIITY